MILFALFLFALIALDVIMVISLLRPGDERKQIIVWKTSAFTLLVTVLGLFVDIIEGMIRGQVEPVNPFIRLAVIATVYCVALLYFKKKHSA